MQTYARRHFIRNSACLLGSVALSRVRAQPGGSRLELIIDVHQHVSYAGRSDEALTAHQRTMGVTTSVLMPSGDRGAGHAGGSGEHEAVLALCQRHPGDFVFLANEIPTRADTQKSLERQLRRGAIGIGEQKFRVDGDSAEMIRVAEVAREFNVPILRHFSHGLYNRHFERFHRMLSRFPTVNFIGHSGAWWANIGRDYEPGKDSPLGPVTAGGLDVIPEIRAA